jgi:hypothetical protein
MPGQKVYENHNFKKISKKSHFTNRKRNEIINFGKASASFTERK